MYINTDAEKKNRLKDVHKQKYRETDTLPDLHNHRRIETKTLTDINKHRH